MILKRLKGRFLDHMQQCFINPHTYIYRQWGILLYHDRPTYKQVHKYTDTSLCSIVEFQNERGTRAITDLSAYAFAPTAGNLNK